MPTGEEIIAQDMFNNCFVKSAISGAMGGVAGVAFGLFSASMENAHGVSVAHLCELGQLRQAVDGWWVVVGESERGRAWAVTRWAAPPQTRCYAQTATL